GSRQGLMGALADAAIAGGAEAIGVMPRHLVAREVAHRGLTQLEMVETMAERKAMMIELADAFVALPGGYGTLDELSEVLTGQQLQLLDKPVGLLNLDGYYDTLLRFFDHATDVGFIRVRSRARLLTATTARELLDALKKG
ncbi:MAG: TIGR00730 family Rossman fold protein, partial [Sinobacteraceae bacterium]|nr:TIGR00730 family Rossman fold protein [Nevskiaceae bacterium]